MLGDFVVENLVLQGPHFSLEDISLIANKNNREEPPKASGGKKLLPQERIFKLPYLWAAAVNCITRESILFFPFKN